MCVQIVMADPVGACSALTGDYAGKVVVFLKSGNCTLDVRGANVQNSNADGGVLLVLPVVPVSILCRCVLVLTHAEVKASTSEAFFRHTHSSCMAHVQ